MFNALFVLLHKFWLWVQPCPLNAHGIPCKESITLQVSGGITSASLQRIEQDHATTYLVKEFIIVGRGLTYVWWSVRGVMDYRLYKIAYHSGDAVYFEGDNKVLYVIDAARKRWW